MDKDSMFFAKREELENAGLWSKHLNMDHLNISEEDFINQLLNRSIIIDDLAFWNAFSRYSRMPIENNSRIKDMPYSVLQKFEPNKNNLYLLKEYLVNKYITIYTHAKTVFADNVPFTNSVGIIDFYDSAKKMKFGDKFDEFFKIVLKSEINKNRKKVHFVTLSLIEELNNKNLISAKGDLEVSDKWVKYYQSKNIDIQNAIKNPDIDLLNTVGQDLDEVLFGWKVNDSKLFALDRYYDKVVSPHSRWSINVKYNNEALIKKYFNEIDTSVLVHQGFGRLYFMERDEDNVPYEGSEFDKFNNFASKMSVLKNVVVEYDKSIEKIVEDAFPSGENNSHLKPEAAEEIKKAYVCFKNKLSMESAKLNAEICEIKNILNDPNVEIGSSKLEFWEKVDKEELMYLIDDFGSMISEEGIKNLQERAQKYSLHKHVYEAYIHKCIDKNNQNIKIKRAEMENLNNDYKSLNALKTHVSGKLDVMQKNKETNNKTNLLVSNLNYVYKNHSKETTTK